VRLPAARRPSQATAFAVQTEQRPFADHFDGRWNYLVVVPAAAGRRKGRFEEVVVMSKLKANRIDPRTHSIPLLPMLASLALVAGVCIVTPLHAQTAAKPDPTAAAEARKGATPKQKPAAEPRGALTYDELGATPKVKLPKKSESSTKPAAPAAQEKSATPQDAKSKP
jgi:hypothetical protein